MADRQWRRSLYLEPRLAGPLRPAGRRPVDAPPEDHADLGLRHGPLPAGRATEPDRRHAPRSEEHTSELQSPCNLVCRLLLEKKKNMHSRHPELEPLVPVSQALFPHTSTTRLS